MHNMIIDAIHNQTCLEFYYDGGMRTVEPHCYGCGRNGELLRAYQVCGYSESGNVEGWKTFTIGKLARCLVRMIHSESGMTLNMEIRL